MRIVDPVNISIDLARIHAKEQLLKKFKIEKKKASRTNKPVKGIEEIVIALWNRKILEVEKEKDSRPDV